ncbi:MAG: hypothetical protein R3320_01835 [Nitriliruptorales bacterium]|nr:hypothetical protein [Nitriliruptorales bacterium]
MKRMMYALAAVALLVGLLPTGAAASGPDGPQPNAKPHTEPYYYVDEASLPFAPVPGLTDQQYWGVLGGAGYRIEVPVNWNGDLVLWAHGYRGEGQELTVDNHPLRLYLLSQGFAWAASSYSENGYAVAEGVRDTMTLLHRFAGIVEKPAKVYMTGASMGGHVTGVAIEQFPDQFAGAMPICGVMGDRELFDYFLDYNVVAAALADVGPVFPAPADYLTDEVPAIKDALWTSFPNVPNGLGLALAGVTEQRSGGDRPLFDIGFVSWADFLFTLNGDGSINGLLNGNVSGNLGTTYQVDADPALSGIEQQINTDVQRVGADRHLRVAKGLTEVPEITGDLRIPTVSLHTLGDLFVPFSMEQIWAREVADHGASDLLVQRAIRDVGHCGFSATELVTAFAELVAWVEHGIVPAGDVVLDPTVVDDADYGCQFTTPLRSYDPGGCAGE